jgi:hypothetical protein
MRFIIHILLLLCITQSCTKARQCECVDSTYDRKENFFINGTKKDAQKACTNMADSTEVCNLITD